MSSSEMTGYEARAFREGMHLSAPELGRLMGLSAGAIYYRERLGGREVPLWYALALKQLLVTRIQLGFPTRKLGFELASPDLRTTNGHAKAH